MVGGAPAATGGGTAPANDTRHPPVADDGSRVSGVGGVDGVGVGGDVSEDFGRLSSSAPTPTLPSYGAVTMQRGGAQPSARPSEASSSATAPLLGGADAASRPSADGGDDGDDDDDDDEGGSSSGSESESVDVGLDGQPLASRRRKKSAAQRAIRGTAKFVTRRLGLSTPRAN